MNKECGEHTVATMPQLQILWRRFARLLPVVAGLAAFACATAQAQAQIEPRLTGAAVIAQLETAQNDLKARAAGLPNAGLAAIGQDLSDITESLRKDLGNDAAKPIEKIGDERKAHAQRGYAAAQQTQAYLSAVTDCIEGDANAMATALAATVAAIAHAPDSGKSVQPAIYSQETLDHRPLFVAHSNGKDVAFALTGVNLTDARCDDPLVTASDVKGTALTAQPTVTGVLPNRIELKLPNELADGTYVLHVVPKTKGLIGCSAEPEATAAIQIAAPVRLAVSYTVIAACRSSSGKKVAGDVVVEPPVTGKLPDITSVGTTASQAVAITACDDPVSYTITAEATAADGSTSAIGPISQSAAAGIAFGLPGGLAFSWDPTVRMIFVRAAKNSCRGAY